MIAFIRNILSAICGKFVKPKLYRVVKITPGGNTIVLESYLSEAEAYLAMSHYEMAIDGSQYLVVLS